MIGTLHWSDCVHLSEAAWELEAFVLTPLVHSTSRPVSPDQGLINTISLSPEVTDLPTDSVEEETDVRGRNQGRPCHEGEVSRLEAEVGEGKATSSGIGGISGTKRRIPEGR